MYHLVKHTQALSRLTTDYADIFPPNHPVRHTRLASSAACYVICKLTYFPPRACQRQTLLAHRFFVKSPLDEEKNLRLGGDDVRVGVMAPMCGRRPEAVLHSQVATFALSSSRPRNRQSPGVNPQPPRSPTVRPRWDPLAMIAGQGPPPTLRTSSRRRPSIRPPRGLLRMPAPTWWSGRSPTWGSSGRT